MLLDTFERVETVDRAIHERRDPAHRFAAPYAKLEVQAPGRNLLHGILDQRLVLLEVRCIGHVRLDVVERLALGLEIHVDEDIRRVVLEHEAPEEKLAQGPLENRTSWTCQAG